MDKAVQKISNHRQYIENLFESIKIDKLLEVFFEIKERFKAADDINSKKEIIAQELEKEMLQSKDRNELIKQILGLSLTAEYSDPKNLKIKIMRDFGLESDSKQSKSEIDKTLEEEIKFLIIEYLLEKNTNYLESASFSLYDLCIYLVSGYCEEPECKYYTTVYPDDEYFKTCFPFINYSVDFFIRIINLLKKHRLNVNEQWEDIINITMGALSYNKYSYKITDENYNDLLNSIKSIIDIFELKSEVFDSFANKVTSSLVWLLYHNKETYTKLNRDLNRYLEDKKSKLNTTHLTATPSPEVGPRIVKERSHKA